MDIEPRSVWDRSDYSGKEATKKTTDSGFSETLMAFILCKNLPKYLEKICVD